MSMKMSSTAFNAQFAKNHKAKLFFEPGSFISVVSRKAKFLKTKNATGPKTGKKICL